MNVQQRLDKGRTKSNRCWMKRQDCKMVGRNTTNQHDARRQTDRMQDDKTAGRMTKVRQMSDGSFRMDESLGTKIDTTTLKVITL
jgi:hypothetical protein